MKSYRWSTPLRIRKQYCVIKIATALVLSLSEIAAVTYVNRHYLPDTTYVLEAVTVSSQETWTLAGSPYILEGWDFNLTIGTGGRLTIEPGVQVLIPSSRDGGALVVHGELNVIGTPQQPVSLIRGDTNGTWSGIRFHAGSVGSLQYAVLEDSGHITFGWQAWHPAAAIYVDGASPLISHVTVLRSQGGGIRVTGNSSPVVEYCNFENSGNHAIAWSSYTGNAAPLFRDNTGLGNSWDVIFIGNGAVTGAVTFARNALPYYMEFWDGNFVVSNPGQLTLEAGVQIKGAYGREGGALVIDSGALLGKGTANEPVILTSILDDSVGGDSNRDGTQSAPKPGEWSGLRFQNGSTGLVTHAIIRYAGHVTTGWQGWHPASSLYLTDSSPIFQNTVIEHNQDAGIKFSKSRARLENLVIRNSGGAACEALNGGLDLLPEFPGSIAVSNGMNGIKLFGNAGSIRLVNYPMPYIVAGWLTVPVNTTLTVDPGTVMMFTAAGSSYISGLSIEGRLEAVGNPTNRIVFTSLNDTAPRGAMLPPSSQRDPARGDWNTIYFQPNSQGRVEYCDLFYAGYLNENWNYLGGGAITVNQSSPRIANNRIYMTGGRYSGNGNHGIRLQNSGSVVESNLVDRAQGFAFYIFGEATEAAPILKNNSAGNCGINAVRLPNYFRTNAVLAYAGVPYVVDVATGQSTNSTVTIAAGNIIKFLAAAWPWDRQWFVEGKLNVEGTSAQPVVFTTILDDSAGGDTNGDGDQTKPLVNGIADWGSIVTYNNGVSQATLAHAEFHYGGYLNQNWTGNGGGMICMWGGLVTARECVFKNPGTGYGEPSRCIIQRGGTLLLQECNLAGGNFGVHVLGSLQTTLDHCRLTGQSSWGVYNASSTIVDARNSWWADPSGPLDNSDDRATGGNYNPNGLGRAVSNQVLYEPWLISATESVVLEIYTAVEIEFPTRAGKLYQIQVSDLSGNLWQDYGQPLAGSGQPLHQLISIKGAPKGFYRVIVQEDQ